MNPRIWQFLTEWRRPVDAGNPNLALCSGIELLAEHGPTRLETRLVVSVLAGIAEASAATLNAAERRAAASALGTLRLPSGVEGDLTMLRERLARDSRPESGAAVGTVRVVLAATQPFLDREFAAVHDLRVGGKFWGGTIHLATGSRPVGTGADDTAYLGFHSGCLAALDYLLTLGLPPLDGAIMTGRYSVTGELPDVRVPIRGESLGLGSAIGLLSRILQIPVPASIVFTGRVHRSGVVGEVAPLAAKIRAVIAKESTQILLPATQRDEATALGARIEVAPVATLGEAVARVFPPQAVAEAVTRLGKIRAPEDSARRAKTMIAPETEARRVLVSFVGKSDPIGTPKDMQGRPIPGEEAGPILAACRDVRPDALLLLYTTRGLNDMTAKADAIRRAIEDLSPGVAVVSWPVDDLDDPTDVNADYAAIVGAIRGFLERYPSPHDAFFLNTTSGTPQMFAAWILIAERRIIDATLLQVVESRFVRAGEARVRPIVMPR